MADLSNSSFIPKRGPVKQKRKSSSRQVYVFTLISYILIFATLLGSGGVYFYTTYLDKEMKKEISQLNTEISSFNETDMQRVQDFELRLQQASDRLDNSVSVVSVFEALEAATIDTVKIQSLELERELDDKFLLLATIETDSFDSTIFQRGVYKRNKSTVAEVSMENVTATNIENSGTQQADDSSKPIVTFDAEIIIPLSTVPYVVRLTDILPPTTFEPVGTSTNTFTPVDNGVETSANNQIDI